MDHSPKDYLRIYLTDHWAAAGGGVALARRIADENSDTSWAAELKDLARQIAADDETLSAIRAIELGEDAAEKGKLRRTAALAAERVSRLKVNGRLFGYSPLSRVIEAESLISGITAKQRLWLALKESVALDLPDFDFQQLAERAETQLVTMRAFHLWAATRAFGVLATA